MRVFVLCKTNPQEVVNVYTDMQTVRELISKDPDNLYCVEKDLIDTTTKMKSMIDINEKVYEPKHFNSIMPFGKYKGQLLGDIIRDDPHYLSWCKDNLSFEMDEECLNLLEYRLANIKER